MKYAFLPLALFATVNDPPRMELFTGYRNDLIHWHLTKGDELLFNERTRNIQFWENGLSFDVIQRDIAFWAAADYAAFGLGWAADGAGYLGYAVNLTPDRTYRVIVLPLFGFSGHYEAMNHYQQTWYGPCIGAGFQIRPVNRLEFKIGYAYNWLHLRVSNEALSLNRWGNFGHNGWAAVEVDLDSAWRAGLAAETNYYFSGNHPTTSGTFKLRWFSISGLATISRRL